MWTLYVFMLLPLAVSASRGICTLPADVGPCDAAITRWFYNIKTQQCETFTYGGCQGNENNFETKMKCRKNCGPRVICTFPPDSGPCEAAINRWFYNYKTQQCETFIYGGCQGNANNFETKMKCIKSCSKPSCDDINCSTTHCPAGVKKDANGCQHKKCQCNCPCKNKKCERNFECVLRENYECKSCPMVAVCDYKLCSIGELFSFPGCAYDKMECPSGFTCKWSPVDAPHGCCPNDACHANPNSGCGTKKKMRWYYDYKKNRCFKFRFGGKGGNNNNFKSKRLCMKRCGK